MSETRLVECVLQDLVLKFQDRMKREEIDALCEAITELQALRWCREHHAELSFTEDAIAINYPPWRAPIFAACATLFLAIEYAKRINAARDSRAETPLGESLRIFSLAVQNVGTALVSLDHAIAATNQLIGPEIVTDDALKNMREQLLSELDTIVRRTQ